MEKFLITKFGDTCNSILNITSPMVEGAHNNLNKYERVMEGICRRGFFTLHSIMVLAYDDFSGDAILDLSRSLIEDMISVEFMKIKGTQNMAEKFLDFTFVEQKNDMDFLIANGGKVDGNQLLETNKNFERVKPKFVRNSKTCKSWSCCNLEEMITELLKNNVIKGWEKDMLLQAYFMGNRKNHLSPSDTLTYISTDFREHTKDSSKEVGLLFSLVCYIKIAHEFACLLHLSDISASLTKALIEMNKDGLRK